MGIRSTGVEQAELYERARSWIAETYNSAEAVMTFDDASTGTIKGTGAGYIILYGHNVRYSYNLSINTKGEKARIEFSNFSGGSDSQDRARHDKIMINFETLAKEFEEAISEGISTDW